MEKNKLTGAPSPNKSIQQKWRIAFHEAGHASGIHLNNKARQLPPVFFNIIFKNNTELTGADDMAYQTANQDSDAVIEGGRLIESLPPSIPSLFDQAVPHDESMGEQIQHYMMAFEADIINLLVGPLAQAKFIANTDGELFTRQLVNLNALTNYGGSSDLALITEYLQSLSCNKNQQDKKLYELFLVAFEFVNRDENWAAITYLAQHIFYSAKTMLCCEEIIGMLDNTVAHFVNRRFKTRHVID